MIVSALLYVAAAVAEIGGCFAFWAWLRLDRSPLWLIPGMLSLVLFAWLLTRIDSDFAGRAYAAYGGVYIVASLAWMWAVEGARPEKYGQRLQVHNLIANLDFSRLPDPIIARLMAGEDPVAVLATAAADGVRLLTAGEG